MEEFFPSESVRRLLPMKCVLHSSWVCNPSEISASRFVGCAFTISFMLPFPLACMGVLGTD